MLLPGDYNLGKNFQCPTQCSTLNTQGVCERIIPYYHHFEVGEVITLEKMVYSAE
jgi:hypothetical protein